MILNELYELYNRLLSWGKDLPREGEWKQEVGLVVVLTPNGRLAEGAPVRRIGSKDKKGKYLSLPLRVFARDKTNSIEPGFLCDKLENFLGIQAKPTKNSGNKASQAEKYRAEMLQKYKGVLSRFETLEKTGLAAVVRFICDWKPERLGEILDSSDIRQDELYLYTVFQIQGCENYVHQELAIQEWWKNTGYSWWYSKKNAVVSQCLVTGNYDAIARTHTPRFKRLGGTLPALVSYNKPAFNSYGKEQSVNAPVSEKVATSYCTALDYLLNSKSNCLQIAGLTIVFWTDIKNKDEDDRAIWLVGTAIEPERLGDAAPDDSHEVEQIREDFNNILHGSLIEKDCISNERFFILGLSPNEGRVVVRSFLVSTYGDFLECIRKHFSLMEISPIKSKNKQELIVSPYMILKASLRLSANEEDIYSTIQDWENVKKLKTELSKNLPNKYSATLMQAILSEHPYPDSLAASIINRIRMEGSLQLKKHLGYYQIRCAFLKAWLSRKKTSYNLKPMLDTNNTEKGYVLGRLFSVFQKVQEEAYPKGVNRTIMDSFYLGASTIPIRVFPRIMRMNHYHLSKLGEEKPGLQVMLKKQIGEILCMINEFPTHLSIEQQAMFALGFYHQTQNFYTTNKKRTDN